MVTFSRTPDAQVRSAHRAAAANRIAERPAPAPKNIRHLIDIGHNRVMLYRRQPITVPPVPVMLGLAVVDLVEKLQREDDIGRRAVMLAQLVRVCTRCVRPVGLRRRLLRRLGLWRPFRDISEGELRGVADFLLKCRQSARILAH